MADVRVVRWQAVLRGDDPQSLSVRQVPPTDPSPIAGTIFASTKLPLRIWFRAIYHMTQTKQGISSIELGRRLVG